MSITINGSTGISGVDGSSTAPAFQGTDTNTGLFYGTDIVGISTGGSERVRVDSSGNVGIGTSSPAAKLSVYDATNCVIQSNSDVTSQIVAVRYSNDTSSSNIIARKARGTFASPSAANSGDTAGSFTAQVFAGTANRPVAQMNGIVDTYTSDTNVSGYLTFNTNGGSTTVTERMRITAAGEVYIAGTTDQGAYNLQCNGTGVWGAGAYVNGSDERIKQDITPIDTGLDVVNKLNPVTYKYKEDWSKDQSIQTGFIAQDLLVALEGKNYVDGIVQQGGEYMSVAYQNIIPLLTKAIQEQQTIINDLKARVTALETSNV